MIKLDIKGIQKAQMRNLEQMRDLTPSGGLGRLIHNVTSWLHRFLVSVIHVDTGSLKGAQHMDYGGLRGEVYTDPMAVNPRSGQRPAVYGVMENARGGTHAFMDQAVAAAPEIVKQTARAFIYEF